MADQVTYYAADIEVGATGVTRFPRHSYAEGAFTVAEV